MKIKYLAAKQKNKAIKYYTLHFHWWKKNNT